MAVAAPLLLLLKACSTDGRDAALCRCCENDVWHFWDRCIKGRRQYIQIVPGGVHCNGADAMKVRGMHCDTNIRFSLCVHTHMYLTSGCHNFGWWMDCLDAHSVSAHAMPYADGDASCNRVRVSWDDDVMQCGSVQGGWGGGGAVVVVGQCHLCSLCYQHTIAACEPAALSCRCALLKPHKCYHGCHCEPCCAYSHKNMLLK
jgi:hypothetical protein